MAKAIIDGVEINKWVVVCDHEPSEPSTGETGTTSGGIDFTKLGYDGTPQDIQDAYDYALEIKNNWDASVTSRYCSFSGDTNLIYFPEVDLSNVTNMYGMFQYSNIQTLPPKLNTSGVTNMEYLFRACETTTKLNVNCFDMSNVQNPSCIFQNCFKLAAISCGEWNLKNATSLSSVFDECRSLKVAEVSNWDVSNVSNFNNTFRNCSSLTTCDVSKWRPTNATSFMQTFSGCTNLEVIDISNWNVTKVYNIGSMFSNCKKIKYLDFRNWDTSQIIRVYESIYGLFNGCENLEQIDGYLDYSGVQQNGYSNSYTYERCSKLRKHEIRNIGKHSGMTKCYLMGSSSGMTLWGESTTEIPDARQSMVNTLVTYTYDRAAAGYKTCNIYVQPQVIARLMDDEKAIISSKGFSLVS